MTSYFAKILSVGVGFLLISGCATLYQSKGLTGGFSDTKLSENTYQVRFQGNGYTSQGRSSQFILRRCAEITLENDKRYFVMSASESESSVSSNSYGTSSFPSGKAVMTIIDDKNDTDKTVLDAVIIVEETDGIAGGELSKKARKNWQKFKSSQR